MADEPSTSHKLERLKGLFQAGLKERIAELQLLYEVVSSHPDTPSIQDLRSAVHKLAGAGATFGFPRVSAFAARFEALLDRKLGEAKRPVPADKALGLDEIREAYESLQNALLLATTEFARIDSEGPPSTSEPGQSVAASWHIVIVTQKNDLFTIFCEALTSPGLHLHRCHQLAALPSVLQSVPARLIVFDVPHCVAGEAVSFALRTVAETIKGLKEENPAISAIVLVDGADFAAQARLADAGVSLVLHHPIESSAVRAALAESVLLPEQSPLRVMILDDDELLLEYYRLHLSAAGLKVCGLQGPQTISEAMIEFRPELLVLDVHLGNESGLDVARVVRQDARFQTIPIIFMSTDGTLRQRHAARAFAADDYLTKPLPARELLLSVEPRARLYRKQHELNESLKETLREKEEAQDRAVAARKNMAHFLATMTHEIRTPLNGVLGMAQLIEKTKLDPEQQEYTTLLKKDGEHLRTLIDNFLDYSKMEAGKFSLHEEPLHVPELITAVGHLVAPLARQAGVRLLLAWSKENQESVLSDNTRLRQVLCNLLSNAIKFSQGGAVLLTAESVSHSNENRVIRFTVSDSGIGMDSGQVSNLFQPFLQVHESDRQLYGGTGLGLSIARHIVRMMGAEIGVRSAKGFGTDFSFEVCFRRNKTDSSEHSRQGQKPESNGLETSQTIFAVAEGEDVRKAELLNRFFTVSQADTSVPFAPSGSPTTHTKVVGFDPDSKTTSADKLLLTADMSPILIDSLFSWKEVDHQVAQRPKRKSEPSARKLEHMKILVAEDQPINQIFITRLLEKSGAEVMLVENGQQAVEAAQTGTFDLILMDCQMPVLDGYEAARAVRRAGCKTPIFALTANAHWDERSRCTAAGMDELITKPVSEEFLLSRILERGSNRGLSNTRARAKARRGNKQASVRSQNSEGSLLTGALTQATREDGTAEQHPLLNASQIATLKGTELGSGTLLDAMMQKWPEMATAFLDGVSHFAACGDLSALRDHAHRMKGAAGNVGAERLYQYCSKLQTLADQGAAQECQLLVTQAHEILKDSGDALALQVTRYDRIG